MSNGVTEGKFGIWEMGAAAYKILLHQRVTNRRKEGPYSPMSVESFDDPQEVVGFVELIFCEYLGKQSQGDFNSGVNSYTYNGSFVLNERFLSRLTERDLAIANWK